MKLLKKLIPLGVVASVAAGVAPTLAACSTTDGWVDGTKAVDTSKFLKYDGDIEEFPDEEAARLGLTEAYFTELKTHKNLASDDYAYAQNQINAVIEILPSYLMTEGVLAEPAFNILKKLLPTLGEETLKTIASLIISPLEGIDIAYLRGQLTNFKVNDYSTATLSYETKFETNFTGHIGFKAYPKEIIDIIEGILGFDSDFDIQIGLKANSKVEKMPMIASQDAISSVKHQMIGVINNPADEPTKERRGMSIIPRLFDIISGNERDGEWAVQFLDDDSWSMSVGLDLDVKLVSEHFSLDVYALTAKDLKLDAEMLTKILEEFMKNQSNASGGIMQGTINAVAQILCGWSTYYFSDVVYVKRPYRP